MSSLRQLLRAYRLLPEQIVRLDPELFGRLEALAQGQGKSVGELVVEALTMTAREMEAETANNQRWQELTPRERQVAALACMGYTNDEIGSCLVISVNTVRTHMRAILEKYQVSSKAALRVQLAGWDFAGWVETELLPTGPLPPMD